MSIYEEYCLPHFINWACGLGAISKQRSLVVPRARGRILEVGFGSGLNLDHYTQQDVEMIWALEPSEGMRRKSAKRIAESPLAIEWLGLSGESVPLDDNSADTVVLTYTLCTIPGFEQALAEMRRILKPGGELLFCEHGSAPTEKLRRWQERINPVWKRLAGGCNLNRPIPTLISEAGFTIHELTEDFIDGPKIAAYNYWGVAGK